MFISIYQYKMEKEFVVAVRGFHHYKSFWVPQPNENLQCKHEVGNAFDIYAIKTCKDDGTIVGHLPRELSRVLKFLLDRGAMISAELVSVHYRKSPLVQGGLEIPCKVIVRMSPTVRNNQLLDRLLELVSTIYSEPDTPVIMGSILTHEKDFLSTDSPPIKKKKETLSRPIKKKKKEPLSRPIHKEKKMDEVVKKTSHDIRDMFRRQGASCSKVPRTERVEENFYINFTYRSTCLQFA